MKIVVSIPVHEKIEVIKDQVENINKYIKFPIIVFHVSASFSEFQRLQQVLSVYQNVFINPERLKTEWADIIHTHISNFKFISSQMKFDYFMMHSSNDMYIREHIENYIRKYDAGFCVRKVTRNNLHWWPANAALRDKVLKNMMIETGQTMVIASQIEGSFYNYESMCRIVHTIECNYHRNEKEEKYTREEIYFSTIASSFIPWENCGRPTTYSEVHNFDRTLWKLKNTARRLYQFVKWIIPQKRYDQFEALCNTILFKFGHYKLQPVLVKKLVQGEKKCIDKNRYLDDGSGAFELYEGTNIFSVKRVERDYNNKVRKYIRNL